MKKKVSLLLIALLFIAAIIIVGCSNNSNETNTNQTYRFLGGAFYNLEEGKVIIGSVYINGIPTSNATVTVNNESLKFGLPIIYEGQVIDILPIFYSNTINFQPGDTLNVKVSSLNRNSDKSSEFYNASIIVPVCVNINNPLNNSTFPENIDINVDWNQTANTILYLLSYAGITSDGGTVFSQVTQQTQGIVPSTATSIGTGLIDVAAFNGENLDEIFAQESNDEEVAITPTESDQYNLPKSYWFASTYDNVNVNIEAQKDEAEKVLYYNEKSKTTTPLKILKVERVKFNGIKLTRYIYDARQITSPGRALISLKLKKWHLAIGAVNVLDVNQNQYYSWQKIRKYKRKNKTYNHNISISPYSTVVIHKKSTKLKRADYAY